MYVHIYVGACVSVWTIVIIVKLRSILCAQVKHWNFGRSINLLNYVAIAAQENFSILYIHGKLRLLPPLSSSNPNTAHIIVIHV